MTARDVPVEPLLVHGRVLIVAGSDSGGGAGIQADIKAVTALSGFAMTAITALTAQSTLGVFGVHPVPPAFVAQQMEVVLDDLGADAVKTGMLHDAEVIDVVARVLAARAPRVPLVVDPVMVAKGGAALLLQSAKDALVTRLLPIATLITPNLPEAEALLGKPIADVAAMREAARALQAMGPSAVLVKGGHLEGEVVTDVLRMPDGAELLFEGPRVVTRSTHGTGCTLASAIAAGLAQGMDLPAAVERARAYLIEAIRTAPGFGRGHGPLNHAHTVSGDRRA
ncbi:Hydroxymethylpyrimidine phosphate kinase ThiD [Minicystis rosea]|nr:Hydroxymethylpyrimidine phosphate kinase ThiD [Minicystis rosea]